MVRIYTGHQKLPRFHINIVYFTIIGSSGSKLRLVEHVRTVVTEHDKKYNLLLVRTVRTIQKD